MCGICYLTRGVHIKQHIFKFPFFEDYVSVQHLGANREWAELSLTQHVIKNGLMLPPIDLREIHRIRPRGPDSFSVCIYSPHQQSIEAVDVQEEISLKEGCSLCCQSVLRLRGDQEEKVDKKRKGVLLYNGEIYLGKDVLSPKPYQSDTQWLQSYLDSIPDQKLDNPESIVSFLRQIRGDFAFLYQRGDFIYLAKDEFGKKSLLLGFQENGFVVSSLPLGKFKSENGAVGEGAEQEDNSKDWMAKYRAEYTAASHKMYFELPKNSLVQVRLGKLQAVWDRWYIHDNWFLRSALDNKCETDPQVNVQQLTEILLESVRELVSNIPQYERHFYEPDHSYEEKLEFEGELTNSHIAVMFSGGLDSTLIARLLDRVLPKKASIDLVNLVFSADAPDRRTALEAIKELRSLSDRSYNLILMDKRLQEVEMISEQHLMRIYPKDTHMDFNISAVLHSACELKGVSDYGDKRPLTSRSKVVLSGLGADELFSGYSRYRVAYNRGGFPQLEREMNFDLERLWLRNLGRDDRATSDRSKQVRYPFLYHPLVKYLKTSVKFQNLTDFSKPKGSGDKVLLRKVAERLGLEITSGFKKTAIQFGTRLAKQSNVKTFGSNRKGKGTYTYQKPE